MELEMESMASAIGVSIAVLRFLLCFAATIPVSLFWRFVPGTLPKHLYAAISGVILSYLSFGFSSNLHFLIPMTLGYGSMVLFRRYSGVFTFFIGFGYLIGCHVYYMSGDAWKEGGIDATGALMVLVLKVISCSINYSDGLLKEEVLREAQKKNRLIRLPNLIEYFGYCLCCGSHFAGPVYEMKDYLEWTEKKGIWKESSPSPFFATLRAIVQAGICMGLYLYLVPHYPLSRFGEPIYQEWGFWKRLSYQYMSGFTARWKYYFIWSLSEASVIISGLGFSGWSDSSPPKPKWNRAKNVNIIGVELATSAAELPIHWNIQVSTWLRYYVYDRIVQKGKKPGFFQLLATQTISAVWHGLYPGYLIFFVQSALMIAGSKVIYRWQQAVNNSVLKNLLTLSNMAYTLLVLNYSCIGFMWKTQRNFPTKRRERWEALRAHSWRLFPEPSVSLTSFLAISTTLFLHSLYQPPVFSGVVHLTSPSIAVVSFLPQRLAPTTHKYNPNSKLTSPFSALHSESRDWTSPTCLDISG